ncbi:unnamed protein product [Mycena citricolor]|uniref:Uncharacterized protein n=1 Tax=Mycena citricolor TaxID=2018698 RepID=A0AAD2HCX7_9AGAR|nr:unnamed protein product [Mycena citricolor]
MTASGPFAMGPAMGTARRSIPKSNFVIPTPANDRTSLGAGLKRLDHPVKSEKGKNKAEEDEDAYSEPDEGVEIIDMEDVRQMDWMAPETIKREKRSAKKPKKKVKTEESTMDIDADTEVAENAAEVDAANALDLSESEEEEEYEDLIEHFANQETAADSEDSSLREERLYFFQFPSPFPTFHAPAASSPTHATPDAPEAPPKKVTFADDVKDELPPAISSRVSSDASDSKAERDTVDGMIGTLEVYRSGAVKMHLQNGILLDVAAATQPSFLQHATLLDLKEKHLTILGEVNKRFVVSPDVETLLTAMELAERPTRKQSATDAS